MSCIKGCSPPPWGCPKTSYFFILLLPMSPYPRGFTSRRLFYIFVYFDDAAVEFIVVVAKSLSFLLSLTLFSSWYVFVIYLDLITTTTIIYIAVVNVAIGKIGKDRIRVNKQKIQYCTSETIFFGWVNLNPSRKILQVDHISNMPRVVVVWSGTYHKANWLLIIDN